ncbi:MAG: NUDIX hydrolase [Caldilineaceae bacterium]|nr:NUDIX hydrolase [Caldilineaceae bacterium]
MNDRGYVLPCKRVAAGALFLDEADRVLLVNPTYKPEWEMPGGIVEENESPRQACIREIKEELGLTIEPGHLVSLDYRSAQAVGHPGDVLRFIFWGGRLSEAEIGQIHLQAEELSEYRFCTRAEVQQRLKPRFAQAVLAGLDLLVSEKTHYVEYWE